MKRRRRIIQIAVDSQEGGQIYVLCEQGMAWTLQSWNEAKWKELPALPEIIESDDPF